MKRLALTLFVAAALISGCREQPGVRGYWSDRTLNVDDYAAAEEEFTDFVEYAVTAPETVAFADIDMLLEKAAGQDDVTYMIYADWILKGFGAIASPCHSCPLFLHAADWILGRGIPSGDITSRLERQRSFCLYNRPGDVARFPELTEGSLPETTRRTLYLLVDQDCTTCRRSMSRFEGPEWEGTALVALCYGRGSLPEEPGWTSYRIRRDQTLLDTRQAPFYYVVSPDGTIEISYTSLYE